jgi:hypothetical protein
MTTFLTLSIAASFLTAVFTCRLFAVGRGMSDASTNIVANTKKTEVDQLIELMRVNSTG